MIRHPGYRTFPEGQRRAAQYREELSDLHIVKEAGVCPGLGLGGAWRQPPAPRRGAFGVAVPHTAPGPPTNLPAHPTLRCGLDGRRKAAVLNWLEDGKRVGREGGVCALDVKTFRNPSGRLVPANGHYAFIPNPLPRSVEYTPTLVMALSQADQALAELRGLGRAMSNPYILIPLFKRREAVLSSKIEGTQTTFVDLAVYEAGQRLLYFDQAVVPGDAPEVFKYIGALDHGLRRLSDLPISLRLIRELHEILLDGVRGGNAHPGHFRDGPVHIGPPGAPIEASRYVPPPRDALPGLLDDFEKALHDRDHVPQLVWLAMLHYQFEAIHPFLDGNGRIGRLLISLLMADLDLMPQPLLYLSAYFEANRSTYYELLLNVSAESAWEEWVVFFLRGVRSQAHDAMARAKRLQDLQADYHQRVQSGKRASALGLRVADALFDSPALSIGMLAKQMEVPYATARFQVNRLVELGVLRIEGRSGKEQLFVAPEILAVVGAPQCAD